MKLKLKINHDDLNSSAGSMPDIFNRSFSVVLTNYLKL